MSDKTPLTQDSSAPEISAREAESRAAPRPVLEAMKAAELSALGNPSEQPSWLAFLTKALAHNFAKVESSLSEL